MIKITFPDNSVREYAEGTTAMQIAESISSRLAQEVLAASVNGETWDLSRPIMQDSTVNLLKWDDEEGKHAFWHSKCPPDGRSPAGTLSWYQVRYRSGY